MKNTSNRTGRAFEYAIVEVLEKHLGTNAKLTPRATQYQERDCQLFFALSDENKHEYIKSSEIIADWAINKMEYLGGAVNIGRLSDQDGVNGDVTDIRLSDSKRALNLSVKHNHSALKHQRPPSTAQWCGYRKGEREDLEFRASYKRIIEDFLNKAKNDFPGANNFCDIKAVSSSYIDTILFIIVQL